MNSVRIRIAGISLLAAMPIFVLTLALLWQLHRTQSATNDVYTFGAALFGLLLLGIGVSFIASHYTVVAPLRRLTSQVGAWQNGNVVEIHSDTDDPDEVAALSQSFVKAVKTLGEQRELLQAASVQQELLMQEIHHRVKNNLQIVASLLNLQASRIRQPQAKAEFQSARDRVRALATLHRHLYAHGEVHTINMREFLTELTGQLLQAMGETEGGRIKLNIQASEIQMTSDQAVPLALIVTEAVSNALKYAFPNGRSGTVSVVLTSTGSVAELVIQDDGVGIPAGKVETETGTRDGIGLQLIRGFARQLGATLRVDEGNGTRYTVNLALASERTPTPQLGAVGKVPA